MSKLYRDFYGHFVPNQFYDEDAKTFYVKDLNGNIVTDVDFSRTKLKRDPKYGHIIPNQVWCSKTNDFIITDKPIMWLPSEIYGGHFYWKSIEKWWEQ